MLCCQVRTLKKKKKDPKGCLASFIVILILITKLASNCSFSVFGVAKQHLSDLEMAFLLLFFYHSQVCSSTRSHAFFSQTCV